MRNTIKFTLCCLMALCILSLVGCGEKADENKPVAEVKAEAEKMDVDQLKAMALKYKDAISDKKVEIEKITAKLKEIPMTKMLGDEAKALKADIDSLSKSLSDLKERFDIYYQKVKEKGGDISDLKL